jgi:hypothetical protein
MAVCIVDGFEVIHVHKYEQPLHAILHHAPENASEASEDEAAAQNA